MDIERWNLSRWRRAVACAAVALLAAAGLSAANNDARLVDAAERQDWQTVRTLLNDNVDVNVSQADGATALQWAAHWDNWSALPPTVAANSKAR